MINIDNQDNLEIYWNASFEEPLKYPNEYVRDIALTALDAIQESTSEKPKKTVNFYENATVVSIPTNEEYEAVTELIDGIDRSLIELLWWTRKESKASKEIAAIEIQEVMSSSRKSSKEALTLLSLPPEVDPDLIFANSKTNSATTARDDLRFITQVYVNKRLKRLLKESLETA